MGSVSSGGARDAFSGTSGSSDWNNSLTSIGMLGSNGAAGDRSDIGLSAMKKAIQKAKNSGIPARVAWADSMRQQLIEARQNDGR